MARGSGSGPVVAGIGVLALLLALGGWFFLIRDTSPDSVDTEAQAEAREAALADAGGDTAADENADDYDDAAPDQADAASTGSGVDGLWGIDSSIGSFDDACLTEVCGSNFVGFRINEELAGVGAKTVVGRTDAVTGTMTIQGATITAAQFDVDMTQLITDDAGRNAAIKGATGGLETQAFPDASFVLTQPVDLGALPAEGVEVTVQATGDLTVHGVTRQVTIPLTAELQAGVIVVFGTLEDMALSDFDIPKPSAIVVLSVEEVAAMELQLFFSR